MKKINMNSFKVTKDAPAMIVKLARYVDDLQKEVVQLKEENELLKKHADVDWELEDLKKKAEELEIDFAHNIKKETLETRINDYLEEKEDDSVSNQEPEDKEEE